MRADERKKHVRRNDSRIGKESALTRTFWGDVLLALFMLLRFIWVLTLCAVFLLSAFTLRFVILSSRRMPLISPQVRILAGADHPCLALDRSAWFEFIQCHKFSRDIAPPERTMNVLLQ
jgi:hypothetical protein